MWAQRFLRRSARQLKTFSRQISARIVNETNIEVLEEIDSRPLTFPGVWLRDNCLCEDCFHGSSKSRKLDWDNFDTRIRPAALEANELTKEVKVKWSDRHESSFSLEWLRARSFQEERQEEYLREFYRPATRHWSGAEFQEIARHFSYEEVMAQDDVLMQWLQALAVYGVALLRNAPLDEGVVRRLAERVGFIRRTTYGEEFVVQAKPGAQNFAYLSLPLPLHTDLPYYEYKPSVNILHCVVQTDSPGGSNMLVDGFHVADILRRDHPEDFERLCRVVVDWNDIGSEDGREFHNIWRAPVICLDAEGRYTRVNHSVPQRDSHFNVPLAEVLPWYESYARFVRLAIADSHAFKTRPGDVLTFNNIRLLHGRTGYDDSAESPRYIVGAYLDWDIIYSRLRVLKRRLGAGALKGGCQ
ncbi:gamma-butyrobetaine dioxygenase [Drosophila biarmipes]|uniref:gamma-butyrobetaine dioxygenase n=1 Tax=Drosophila biarmipes TaxID=125945 RepID=UPI0007E5DD95|nr:gamma-butyrobetaine dioxygenase [Drosophila biarmipes]